MFPSNKGLSSLIDIVVLKLTITVKLSNLLVSNANIGVSSKDSSTISIDSANIKNTEICFEAKRKKQEFLGGIINLNNYDCNGSPISKDLGSFIHYH